MKLRLALLAALVAPTPAFAEPPAPGPIAVRLVEDYLLPRYETFAAATAAQAKAWEAACADGDAAAELAELKTRYGAAADGWAAVEHVTTGPMSVDLRSDRVFFAPDRRNAVAKALADLEGKAANGPIPQEQVPQVSAAGQGFPALERLIYEPDQATPAVRCRVGVAISQNLAAIAGAVVTEWRADPGPLAHLKRGEGDPVHFADPAQALARLMTDLAGGVQRVNDLKLLPVLGQTIDLARPKAAEGWRSGRSARAVKVAVASLVAMAKVLDDAAPKPAGPANAKLFAAAEAAANKLPDDLGAAAADPKRRRGVEAVVSTLKTAQADFATTLASALGVPLGFNALDGD